MQSLEPVLRPIVLDGPVALGAEINYELLPEQLPLVRGERLCHTHGRARRSQLCACDQSRQKGAPKMVDIGVNTEASPEMVDVGVDTSMDMNRERPSVISFVPAAPISCDAAVAEGVDQVEIDLELWPGVLEEGALDNVVDDAWLAELLDC